MEGETSWISHRIDNSAKGHWFDNYAKSGGEFDKFSDLNGNGNEENVVVSMDLILPVELLERILTYLPIPSIFRAGSVCKRWHEIISSRRFRWNLPVSRKPWYFMFMGSDEPTGYAYDPVLRKWYNIELPCIDKPNWFIASSWGLVCFMDNDSRSVLYVCNPISRCCRRLQEPPGLKFPDYSALAISVNRLLQGYDVSVVKSRQVPGDIFHWNLSIHLYNSQTMMWVTSLSEVLTGWRAGDESVICDGVLYFLLYSTGVGMIGHSLIAYDLSRVPHGSVMKSCIPVPCLLTCGRLMNLNDKLVMVGGIGKPDRPGIIKGIGIWVLEGNEWREITRMPPKYFQGFGEFDDVFASSGMDDLIYVQSYGAPALLAFNVNLKQWKWSQKYPVTKKFPLQLFTGFCFEPNLGITP